MFFFSDSAGWKLFVHSECSDCSLKAGLSSEKWTVLIYISAELPVLLGFRMFAESSTERQTHQKNRWSGAGSTFSYADPLFLKTAVFHKLKPNNVLS